MKNAEKYTIGYYPAPTESLKWVHKDHLEKPPIWCSVDLREGNRGWLPSRI